MTDIIGVLLDRSGSMESCAEQTVAGVNRFLSNMREDRRGRAARLNLVTFDSIGFDVLRRGVTAEVDDLKKGEYQPRALTPLLDAVGFSIEEIERLGEVGRKLLVIVTDGLENASKKWQLPQLRALIDKKRAEGWVIIYLGANIDAWQQAAELGIPNEYAMNFRANGATAPNAPPQPGFWRRLGGHVAEHPVAYALGAAATVGLAAWALSPGSAHASGFGFSEEQRNHSMGVTNNWQDAVREDVAAFDEPFDCIMDLPPDVMEMASTLSSDFDPTLGSPDENGDQPGILDDDVLSESDVPSGDNDGSEDSGPDTEMDGDSDDDPGDSSDC